MENIEISIEKSILILKIDLSQKGTISKTGKMQLLAKSGGFKPIEQSYLDKKITMNLMLGYKRA